jgi:CHASE2 domain-containing sensor protein
MKISKTRKLHLKDTILCTLLSFLLVAILSLVVVNMSFFNPFVKAVKDFSFLDVYYAENLGSNPTINPEIILLNIEHRDRFEIAQLLEEVIKQDPKVIGIDMIFKAEKEPFSDSLLAINLKNEKIVQAYIIENTETIYNHSMFRNNNEGFVNLNFDNQESVIREFTGIYEKDNTLLAWNTKIAKLTLGDSIWKERNYEKHLKGKTPITYLGNYTSFLHFGYDEFILNSNKEILKDKIVLIGYIGDPTGNIYDVEDKHFTPLNKVTAGKSIPDMFGLVVHANIISMLLNDDFLYRISNFWIGIITLLCNFFLIMYFIKLDKTDKLGARTKSKLTFFIFTIVITGIALALFNLGIILKVAPIIAITAFSLSVVKYYKHLIKYLQTKITWKSYISQ